MFRRVAFLTLLIALAFNGTVVSADNDGHEINERIKTLREKLEKFRTRTEANDEPTVPCIPADIPEENPEELSKALESREDVKILVLYHEQGIQNPTPIIEIKTTDEVSEKVQQRIDTLKTINELRSKIQICLREESAQKLTNDDLQMTFAKSKTP